MCGIAVFQGTHDARLAQEICDALAHRGPDGEGTFVVPEDGGDIRTAFAHRRLSIIDTSPAGKQPMWIDCNTFDAHNLNDLALTYSGEIYNYKELRAELQSRGHSFRTATDSEILMHLMASASGPLGRTLGRCASSRSLRAASSGGARSRRSRCRSRGGRRCSFASRSMA
jgi:asparagine synthase (glutamine-hydrolysing)